MNGKFLFSALLIMLLALAGCGQQGAEPAEEQAAAETAASETDDQPNPAWEAMLTELQAVETNEEKVPILKKFVADYPNDENAAYALSGVIYYLGEAIGDSYTNIENLVGSRHNDNLTGDTNANPLLVGDHKKFSTPEA